jgi:hypothetical protein
MMKCGNCGFTWNCFRCLFWHKNLFGKSGECLRDDDTPCYCPECGMEKLLSINKHEEVENELYRINYENQTRLGLLTEKHLKLRWEP